MWCLRDRTVKPNSALGNWVKFLKKLYRGVSEGIFSEKISKIIVGGKPLALTRLNRKEPGALLCNAVSDKKYLLS